MSRCPHRRFETERVRDRDDGVVSVSTACAASDRVARSEGDARSYPAFDILREADDRFSITLAVPGFKSDEIEIVAQNQFSVTGKPAEEGEKRAYLHHGIARRAFERRFQLADYIEVGNASFADGLLTIELSRVVPEAMKPRKIEIGSSAGDRRRIGAPKDKALENA